MFLSETMSAICQDVNYVICEYAACECKRYWSVVGSVIFLRMVLTSRSKIGKTGAYSAALSINEGIKSWPLALSVVSVWRVVHASLSCQM